MREILKKCKTAVRWGIVAVLLWLVWVAWKPVYFAIPKDVATPQTLAEVAALKPGTVFLLEGRVEPIAPLRPLPEHGTPAPAVASSELPATRNEKALSRDAQTEPAGARVAAFPATQVVQNANQPLWQGRFVYRHRMRKDVSAGLGGKAVQVVTLADVRPALRVVAADGEWLLAQDGYTIDHAPRVPARFWPRKWLLTTPVDDWDRTSSGFFPEETALAYGTVDAAGRPIIEQLMQAPVSAAGEAIGNKNRARWWLILFAKVAISLFVLSFVCTKRKSEGDGLASGAGAE